MKYSKQNLREISFPVGGIGAGCVGLSGNGRLIDWEIFNSPNKNSTNGFSHFAVRVEKGGAVVDARVLNGDQQKDLIGTGPDFPVGFGFGTRQESMCGFPHFRKCTFDGAFPVAEVRLEDPDFPGIAKVRAWSPFVPGDSDTASMPCAIYEIEIRNTTKERLSYVCGSVLSNPWKEVGSYHEVLHSGALTQLVLHNGAAPDDLQYGELAISTDSRDVLSQEYLFRGRWMDRYEVYWHDWTQAGNLPSRHYPARTECFQEGNDSGILAGRLTLEPGKRGVVRFVLSWYVPNRCMPNMEGRKDYAAELKRLGMENRWRNYYASLCTGAADAGKRLFARFSSVRRKVFLFQKTLHRSSIPQAAVEGAAANLAVLVSPTCLRLEDGTFWGWEGVAQASGSCHGSCQHVWNYAQAMPLLFPDLERTLRQSHAWYGFDDAGGWQFRLDLPLGVKIAHFRPCVDGSFGEVMKIFREWKISGDTEWLRTVWPAVRKAMEWAWSEKNGDRWDPGRTGLLSGRQHHTLDIEFFGPSAWLNGHYLGALKATSLMASACGEEAFGRECAALFERGCKASEEVLFNGEAYVQRVDFRDRSIVDAFGASEYWDEEHGQIKYQMGEGCAADALLAQWYASLYGLGRIFNPERVRKALGTLWKNNFFPSMRRHVNPWRVFMKDDEAGLVICTWPEGVEKPIIPVPYNTESFTGVEWAVASHLVMNGYVEEGTRLAAAIRERYDGNRRNPWNEYECGSNYARSMASFGMLQAYSGFSYDMVEGWIGFKPVLEGAFRTFWSLGKVWGEYERTEAGDTIRILCGSARFTGFAVEGSRVALNGEPVEVERVGACLKMKEARVLAAGDVVSFWR